MSSHEYSQGTCQEGVAILRDGEPMKPEEIIAELEKGHAVCADGTESVAEIVSINGRNFISMDDETLESLKPGTNLYTIGTGAVPDKEQLKAACTDFFYWWYNQPGSNTHQGFDAWFDEVGFSHFAAAGNGAWLHEVAAERHRQDQKWGGPAHDDQKSPNDFVQHIEDYAGWARVMAGMGSFEKYRRRMVQVAALAGAAIEAVDRAMKRNSLSAGKGGD